MSCLGSTTAKTQLIANRELKVNHRAPVRAWCGETTAFENNRLTIGEQCDAIQNFIELSKFRHMENADAEVR